MDEDGPLTTEEAVAALDAINGGDPEDAHGEADWILRRAADPEVQAAYSRLMERADGWWFA